MANNLSNQTILVTRPDPAGQTLCQLIEAAGGHAIHMPTIAIIPIRDEVAVTHGISRLGSQDWIIFISPQAVEVAMPLIKRAFPQGLSQVKCAAQGEGTAKMLEAAGLKVDIYPKQASDSEALLTLPVFLAPAGLHISIIRGEGGRELIGNTLRGRGAIVREILAYRRRLPQGNIANFLEQMKKKPLNVIVSSSFEVVQNLKKMVGETGWPYIKSVPLIVMSERVKALAEALNFETVWVVRQANFEALIDVIAQRGKAHDSGN